MKVSDVKILVPLADVYEINPNAKYIVLVDSRHSNLERMCESLRGTMEGVLITVLEPESVKIHEITPPEKESQG